MIKYFCRKGENMTKKLYFCASCRKSVNKIEELLFVEESDRGFCCEDCIVDFYTPYMEFFDKEEINLREQLGLVPSEVDIGLYQDKELFEKVLYTPDEIWLEKSELNEKYHTHILKIDNNNYFILTASYYESEPAFVFFKTITNSLELVKMYRRGEKIDPHLEKTDDFQGHNSEKHEEVEVLDEVQLPAEIIEDIELKKSEHIALLLERRKESDIDFEKYPLYDDYLSLTLEDPDDEFHGEDEAGDNIMTFIKSFKKSEDAFFYIAICLQVDIPGTDEVALLPVLSFPSNDDDLYTFYAVGNRKNNRITN
jgi:hypothetical protein